MRRVLFYTITFMKNTISERIADFLKKYPPFMLFTPDELDHISQQVVIKYLEKDGILFEKNDKAHKYFYIVHKGAITLHLLQDKIARTIDNCDEGDIFGLRPLIAREDFYQIGAKAAEESILYSIPIEAFKPIILENREAGIFLIENFASNAPDPYTGKHREDLYSDEKHIARSPSKSLFELQPVPYKKKLVTAKSGSEIKTIAKKMSNKGVGSIIIVDNKIPMGIVTDKDLRTQVATGKVSVDEKVDNIMTSPVICYPANISIAQAQIAMMKHKIGHLCITKDGTPNTALQGMISEHDLVVLKGNDPAVLMKAIKRAKKTKALKAIREKVMLLLKGYIDQNIPLTHTSKIITELNDATIKRIIELSLENMDDVPVKFAWLSLGSQGRKEQLLHTDQDNALIFEDVPETSYDETKAFFLKLAAAVTKKLNAVGYEYCPAEMMASNAKWCLSLSEWKRQFSHWMNEAGEEEIMLCSIFFDYDIAYGELELIKELSEHIFSITERNEIFLAKLGKSALMNPSPLGFFRQFIVEQNGEHKDFFDLKKRALMPLVDAGRILILSHRIKHINNTAERFEKLAELEPENKELYLSCAYAFKALLKFRTRQGLLHNDSGRYLALKTLSKEEKIKLKRCFKTISNIQELLKIRFKIAFFL
jgi:CBS domain-containing protein